MTNIKFLKTLTVGVALTLATCPQAWAACPGGFSRDSSSGLCVNSNACGGNCTYYYNDTTFDFEAKVNPNVAAGTPVLLTKIIGSYEGKKLHNAIIGEGITGFDNNYVFFNNPTDPEIGKGTLTLPSTFNDSLTYQGIHTDAFATYDLSAMKNANLMIGSSSSYDIIMNDDANLSIVKNCPYSNCPSAVNIQCRGTQSECSKQLKNVYYNWSGTTINTSYYTGLNEDGNWEVWSDDGVALYADSTLQKPLGKYDFEGNQTGIYKYDGAGNLTAAYENGVSTYKKTSYTPAEAAAAVKKGNNNKVTLTFK